jgi:hypothetical protein
LIDDPRSDVIGRQQVFERITVEQRRPLVGLVRALNLNAIDFLWIIEDLPNSERLLRIAFEDLHAKRIYDSITTITAEREGVHGIRCAASHASEEFEGSWWSHWTVKHTDRGSCDSSMNPQGVKSPNSARPIALCLTGSE